MSTLWDITEDKRHKAERTGQELRDRGIEQAVSHAGQKWTDQAYQFLLLFCNGHAEFMAEDVRRASKGCVPEPPSKRAWGGVIVRASKAGLIERVGYRQVKNAKAHCTPAAVWRRKGREL